MNRKKYLGLLALITLACIIGGSIWHGHRPARYSDETEIAEALEEAADALEEAGTDADDPEEIEFDDADLTNIEETVLAGTVENGEALAFTELYIDTASLDLNIRTGDAYAVTYRMNASDEKYAPTAVVKDGLLTIRQKSPFEINLNNLLGQSDWGMLKQLIGWSSGYSGEINITIPKDALLGKAEINIGACDVLIDGITMEILKLDNGAGDLTVQNSTMDSADINCGAGDVDLKNMQAKDITVDTGAGEVDLERVVFEKLDVDSGTGDVEIDGLANMQDYSMDLDVGAGTIRLGSPFNARFDSEYTQKGKDGYYIFIDTGAGDIEIKN